MSSNTETCTAFQHVVLLSDPQTGVASLFKVIDMQERTQTEQKSANSRMEKDEKHPIRLRLFFADASAQKSYKASSNQRPMHLYDEKTNPTCFWDITGITLSQYIIRANDQLTNPGNALKIVDLNLILSPPK